MINVTFLDMLNANGVLHKLQHETLPGKQALIVARLIREVQRELETYDVVRMEIIDKYALHDENGQMMIENGNASIPEENLMECRKELEENLSQEVNLNVTPIEEDWLDAIHLGVDEALGIEPFIKK